MKLSQKQEAAYIAGINLKKEYPEYCFDNAITYAINSNEDFIDIMDDIYYSDCWAFFKAGFNGFVPRYVTAYRYGDIPKSGYSTNWATGEREPGVSVICIGDKQVSTIYDTIYGLQDIPKIKVQGWYTGLYGSDGEPVLHDVTVI